MEDRTKTPHLSGKNISVNTRARGRAPINPEIKELVFYDVEDPRCVVNLMSPTMKARALGLPPEILSKSIRQLEQEFTPTENDRNLRLAFWDEYFVTQDGNFKSMRMEAVYSLFCTKELFYTTIRNQLKLAYMLIPPENYMYKNRAMLQMTMDRIYEVLQLPIVQETISSGGIVTKKADVGVISQIVKIYGMLDNRVNGAVPKHVTIDGTQKNLHVHANAQQLPENSQNVADELAKIREELKELSENNPNLLGHTGEEDDIIDIETSRTQT